MTTDCYILKNKKVVKAKNWKEWSMWMFGDGNNGMKNRRVAKTSLKKFDVFTSFLGLNHSFLGKRKPVVFETMVYDNRTKKWLDIQTRYRTWEEAEEGHRVVVRAVQKLATLKKTKTKK